MLTRRGIAEPPPVHREAPVNPHNMQPQDWTSLRLCPLFRKLDDETVRRVVGRARIQTFDRGQQIFTQGDQADAFFVVLDGWVKLYRLSADGDEAVVTVVARSEAFAEPVVFLGGKYPVCASAASRCRLLRMEYDVFVQCLRSEQDLASAMLASIAWRAAALTEQIGMLKVLTAPQRVAEFLLEIGRTAQDGAEIPLPYEKSLIAARLGMTPESFSRALAALKKIGVAIDRNHVAIADIAALRQFAKIDPAF
jgi:CRP-like cAMP-binding protein